MERSRFVAELRGGAELVPSGDGKHVNFVGEAIMFNSLSEPLWTKAGPFRERVLPGAFDEVLERSPDVALLYNHDDSSVMARTSAGNLELTKDKDSIRVFAKLDPNDLDVQRLQPKMAAGNVRKMSFAFEMDETRGAQDEWFTNDDGEIQRDIIKVSDLFDVSAVTSPAYQDTSAAMRELRAAADAGKISLPHDAAPETAGEESDLESAPADPAVGEERDASAEAETDPPVSGMAALKAESREAVERAKESYLRSLKEITR